MTLNDLINKHVFPKYDLVCFYASKIIGKKILLEKYYLQSQEYDRFASQFQNSNGYNTESFYISVGYSYIYREQTVDFEEFKKLFQIDLPIAQESPVLDSLNYQIRNTALVIRSEMESFLDRQYSSRVMVNAFFEQEENFTKYIVIPTEEASYGTTRPTTTALKDLLDLSCYGENDVALRMYNVGQANCSALYIGGRPRLIFDLGKSRECQPARHLLSNKLLDFSDRVVFIVSHFDNDHINMAGSISANRGNLNFVVPFFHRSLYASKPNVQLIVSCSLYHGNKLFIIPDEFLSAPINTKHFSLYQGSARKKDKNQSTDQNSHGLIGLIEYNGKIVWIPGDVLYDDLYTTIGQPLKPTYVIIPHHSCRYKKTISSGIIDLTDLSESFTFCGPHRGFHHPNKTHFDQYSVNNAKLIRLARKGEAGIVFDGSSSVKDNFYTVLTDDYYEWSL